MLFINNTSTDIYFNLAVEEHLLKNHAEDVFMLWQSDNAVVLGKYQNAQTEIDLDFVDKNRINIARRYSGGGTVYQDAGNVNLTFIENTNCINFDKYVQQVLDLLSFIGIYAQADERRGIHVNQSKISGSAQCIYKGRAMYHCTLLYSSDLDALRLSLNGKPEQAGNRPENRHALSVKSVKSEVTNICELLPYPLGMGDFKRLVFNFFFNRTPGNHTYNLNTEDLTIVRQLKNEKYAIREWILDKYIKQPLVNY